MSRTYVVYLRGFATRTQLRRHKAIGLIKAKNWREAFTAAIDKFGYLQSLHVTVRTVTKCSTQDINQARWADDDRDAEARY